MNTKADNTIIAFLLAFQDLKTALGEQEKQNLKEVAKQLDTQPKAWEDYIKGRLLEIITPNPELNQSYQFYKSQLDDLEEIPDDLLPTEAEISGFNTFATYPLTRGFKPKYEATGYETQLNNVVVIVGSSEKPEETVKQVKFLEKWKQILSQSNQSN
ncbi:MULTISPECIES: hypothetical protein [unclassified Nostoc]|uniref:hypothetical protein n=1 Tax=unclassified Nostoc TaxID=2593658 RepID=UPI0025AAD6CC|nr:MULTISPECIES: hypothetical protein [unclassified Nostoc]MDM9585560.1 hypothetical protein [Nostoc sp. GT001]MDZ7944287.1 hypothetical protein [Nostoc sp. EfeVER01]MDZ7996174.1 hypothetical protein [Nostoc sp. EspVER01]